MKDIYFAACAENGGIYHYKKDGEKIEFVKKYDLDRPMFLAIEKNRMYVVLRDCFDGSSGVCSFKIEEDGSLSDCTLPVSTRGKCACHICVKDGKAYAANYLSGTLCLVGERLVAHTGKGPVADRQEGPHCHYVNFDPKGKYLYCCDLGNDTVYTYDEALNEVSRAKVPEGEGCRHLVFSKKHNIVYCLNELGSSVTVFEEKDGTLKALETYTALPKNPKTPTKAAATRLSEDEKYLYASNRGDDSICTFAVSEDGRKLEQKCFASVNGESPRDFDVIDGVMFCTNEFTDNVTVFAEKDGNFEDTGIILRMEHPLCVVAK